jgi:glyoxylase-like metal-dependent hydrolase (beta-lactamase superfamily II)
MLSGSSEPPTPLGASAGHLDSASGSPHRGLGATDAAAGLHVLTAPNASPMTLEGTNTYLLGDGAQAVVIDPGPDDPAHVAGILAHVRDAGRRVVLILVTHGHADHVGGAPRLARETGAPVARWLAGDRPLEDGQDTGIGGLRLCALHTPGHAPDHLAFLWEARRVLFSGDLVLGSGTVAITPPAGSMADYLRSLRRIARLDLAAIAPGHGPIIGDPAEQLAAYIAHREMRERQVLDALHDGARTPGEIAGIVYPDLDPRLHPAAEGQVRAHLLKLLDEGRVEREGSRYYVPS